MGHDPGYIVISRKCFDGGDRYWPRGRRFSPFEAWVDLLQLAAWEDGKTMNGERLHRGEICGSVRWFADRWKWPRGVGHLFLENAQKAGHLVRQRSGQRGTVYLIANYEYYQRLSTRSRTPSRTPSRTEAGHRPDNYIGKGSKDNEGINYVLQHYGQTHRRRKVGDEKQVKLVGKWLAHGFTLEQLSQAITGNARDPWHAKIRKHGLDYVLRDADHINDFLDKYHDQERPAEEIR